MAIVASARQTNEELFLLKKLATRLGALTDSVPRCGEGDQLLVNADKNPNSMGARFLGVCYTEMGINLPRIADGISKGTIKTLIVFGEDVTKHGLGAALARQAGDAHRQRHPAERHHRPGSLFVARLRPRGKARHLHQRQRKSAEIHESVEPRGDARPEWEFLHELVFHVTGQNGFASIEGLFNQMAKEIPAFQGLTWAAFGRQRRDDTEFMV